MFTHKLITLTLLAGIGLAPLSVQAAPVASSQPATPVSATQADRAIPSWARSYGGSGTEDAYSIVATADGGYAVAGYAGGDAWVLKLGADGSIGPECGLVGTSTATISTSTATIVPRRRLALLPAPRRQ